MVRAAMMSAAVLAVAAGCTGPKCDTYKVDPAKVAAAERTQYVTVVMGTTLGDITLELDRLNAPISVANFLKYARGEGGARDYSGTVFHRVVPGFVIQGGGYTPELVEIKETTTIASEWTNGLKNLRGTIAWARETDPNSATREFYINVADNERLDRPREVSGNAGYAVFGRVVAGMDVVDAIVARAAAEGGRREIPERDMQNVPTDLVAVTGVRVVE